MVDILKALIQHIVESLNKAIPQQYKKLLKLLILFVSMVFLSGLIHYWVLEDLKKQKLLVQIITSKSFITSTLTICLFVCILIIRSSVRSNEKLRVLLSSLIGVTGIISIVLVSLYCGPPPKTNHLMIDLYPIVDSNKNAKALNFNHDVLKTIISKLNSYQKSFEFTLNYPQPLPPEADHMFVVTGQLTTPFYDFLLAQSATGRNVRVALTPNQLEGNIFSQTILSKRIAVISTDDVDDRSINKTKDALFVYKYIIGKAMASALVIESKSNYHRIGKFYGCFFDSKYDKTDLYFNIQTPDLCTFHRAKISKSVTVEVFEDALNTIKFHWIDSDLREKINLLNE